MKRTESMLEVYSITLRGVNRCRVFNDTSDKAEFLARMMKMAEKYEVRIIAYCLAKACVKLVVTGEIESIGIFIKASCISYVRHHFNRKYQRVGSLFNPRYVSRTAEQEGGIIRSVKKVIRAAVDLGEAESLENEFTSYSETIKAYAMNEDNEKSGIETNLIRNEMELQAFIREMNRKERFGVVFDGYCLIESQIRRHVRRVCGIKEWSEFKRLGKKIRSEVIKGLKESGISLSRLSRSLKIGRRELLTLVN